MRWCVSPQQGGSTSALPKAASAGSAGSALGTLRAPVLVSLSPESSEEHVSVTLGHSHSALPGYYYWETAGPGMGDPVSWVLEVLSVHCQDLYVNDCPDQGLQSPPLP